MAKVLNLSGFPIDLYAKDGDSCTISVGENKIQDKFCANLPPKVVITEKPKQAKSIKPVKVISEKKTKGEEK